MSAEGSPQALQVLQSAQRGSKTRLAVVQSVRRGVGADFASVAKMRGEGLKCVSQTCKVSAEGLNCILHVFQGLFSPQITQIYKIIIRQRHEEINNKICVICGETRIHSVFRLSTGLAVAAR